MPVWKYLFQSAYDRLSRRPQLKPKVKPLNRGKGRTQIASEINKPIDISMRGLDISDYMEVKEK